MGRALERRLSELEKTAESHVTLFAFQDFRHEDLFTIGEQHYTEEAIDDLSAAGHTVITFVHEEVDALWMS